MTQISHKTMIFYNINEVSSFETVHFIDLFTNMPSMIHYCICSCVVTKFRGDTKLRCTYPLSTLNHKNTHCALHQPFLEEPLPKFDVCGPALILIVADFDAAVEGGPVAGDAIVHLKVYDEHQREEYEERADGEREALFQFHVEHGARVRAARRGRTARMVGRRRPLTVARALAQPAAPARARPPAYSAKESTG